MVRRQGDHRNGGGKKNHRAVTSNTVILANYAVDKSCGLSAAIIRHALVIVNALWKTCGKPVENLWKTLWKNLWNIARRASIKYDDAKIFIRGAL